MNKKFIVRGDIPKEPALTIKNQLLLSPGQWKGQKITKDAILKGLQNTNWSDRKSRDVIYGHKTNNETTYFGDPSPDIWVGYHTEPKYLTLSDGVDYEGMYADIHIFDQDLASKIAYGGAKAGISEGMEYDYYSGEIKSFLNSSVVNNPACKLAYLNLSEDSQNLGVAEPRFLNLADEENKDDGEKKEEEVEDKKEDESKLNLSDYTDERRSNDVMEKQLDEMDKRLKAMETKFLNLSNEQSEEESKEKSEDKPKESDEKEVPKETEAKAEESKEEPKKKEEPVKEKPKPEPKSEEQEEKPKEEVSKETESKGESKAVVLEKEKSQESEDKVVKAVEKMGEKIAEEFKKAAKPQTSAPTNPDASMSNVDEEVAQKLVEKYKQLHPTN